MENQHVVMAFPPSGSPASTEDYVSLKGCDHATVLIAIDNATSVTGLTITLKQATAVGATSEKALGFDYVYKNENTASSDAFTRTAVTSDTFDSITTNNLNLLYAIEVPASSLDTENDFDCLRVDVTGNANSDCSGLYILNRQRYLGGVPSVSAITD